VDATATFQQQRLHVPLCQHVQQRIEWDAAVTIRWQENNLCARGFELALAREHPSVWAPGQGAHDEHGLSVE
jgi:hypothetical protein